MKRKEILVLIGEVLGSRAVYSMASLVITVTMLSGITIILRNDIRDIKNYVQSVVDKDPNYKEVHGQVSGSENVIRGNIDVEALLAKEDKKTEDANTASNINSGYDNYTPTQTITDDISNRPSNNLNNSTTGETTVADNNNSNNNSNNSTNEVNNSNNNSDNNSDEDKKEDVLDRSSFNGKDIMISEGEPFNPMNGLQLAATDINGKNITNKIVIKENNVDTYKPGLYTVKAAVELSDKSNLEKEFFVRVEPTVLNLVVNDVKTSKDILEKNEEFNLNFSVKSSKSYLEVVSININDKDYDVRKTVSNNFFKASDKYEVNLVAPSKGGVEKIKIKSVTMSDGTVVDIEKFVEIEVLKEDAVINENETEINVDYDGNFSVAFKIEDEDNAIYESKVCLFDENGNLMEEYATESNKKQYYDFKVNESGVYTLKIIAKYVKKENEEDKQTTDEFELLSKKIQVEINKDSEESENEPSVISYYDEFEKNSYGIEDDNYMVRSARELVTGSSENTHSANINIVGNITSASGEVVSGVLNVSIPTNLAFNVDVNSNVIASSLKISNNSDKAIDVYLENFIDLDDDNGIKLVDNKIVDDKNSRNEINLKFSGNAGNFYVGNKKILKNLDGQVNENISRKISTVRGQSEEDILLTGSAGTNEKVIDKPIQNKFIVTFKIVKSN